MYILVTDCLTIFIIFPLNKKFYIPNFAENIFIYVFISYLKLIDCRRIEKKKYIVETKHSQMKTKPLSNKILIIIFKLRSKTIVLKAKRKEKNAN